MLSKLQPVNDALVLDFFDALQQKSDDELAEEVLRSWLLTKRPMLAAANGPDHSGTTAMSSPGFDC